MDWKYVALTPFVHYLDLLLSEWSMKALAKFGLGVCLRGVMSAMTSSDSKPGGLLSFIHGSSTESSF